MTAARNDTRRYCRKCGYSLRGLADNRCPECATDCDPRDARTFRGSPGGRQRAIRGAILVVGGIAVALLVWTTLAWGRRNYTEVRIVEVCVECGARRDHHTRLLGGFEVWASEAKPVHTGISQFLAAKCGRHEHEWVCAGQQGFDYDGKSTFFAFGRGLGVWQAATSDCSLESLQHVESVMPELADRIRRDILGTRDDSVALPCSNLLRWMCQTRNPLVLQWHRYNWHTLTLGGGRPSEATSLR